MCTIYLKKRKFCHIGAKLCIIFAYRRGFVSGSGEQKNMYGTKPDLATPEDFI